MDEIDDDDGDYFLALPKGTLLFEYRIESVLGQGGFGITYLARDTLLDEAVAIKEYFPNENAIRTRDLTARAKSPQDRESFRIGLEAFLGEARIIARFRHRNIMQVRRFFEYHGTGYIVLQFESGQSFEDVVADGPLPESEILPIFAGILDGLDVVHEQAILHRDIKPRNVIIRDDGTPVLIDFGAARDFSERDSRTVTKMASPGYSPPEQYGVGSQQGPWSDFYALGAMMYRAVTGKVPADSLRRLRNDPLVPALQSAGNRYSKPLLRVIDHMMRIDERERPASVAEIRAALASLSPRFVRPDRETRRATGAKPQTDPAPSHATKRGATKRGATPLTRPTMIALGSGAAAVLVIALGAFVFLRNPPPAVGPDVAVLKPADQGETLEPGDKAKPPAAGTQADTAVKPPATPKVAFAPGSVFKDCPTCPELTVLPPGHFQMGANDGFPNEMPVHDVVINAAFAIGRRPVTFAEWDACTAGGGCDYRPADEGWGRGDRPVVNVSWHDAKAYVAWLSRTAGAAYRLPSEAEWEYAARAGTTTPFWWGADLGDAPVLCADCLTPRPISTKPTGSAPANAFGLFDMAGNAAEWIEDCWKDSYTDAPSDGTPVTSQDCPQHGLRGGSFKDDARYLRTSARFRTATDLRTDANGFRVVRDAGDAH